MASHDGSKVSADIEQQESLNLPDEERGISRLKGRIPADTMCSLPPSNGPRVPLAENTVRQVRNWLAGSPGSASNILWLSGIPTSFTSNDIADLCRETSFLAASFSFSTRKGSDQLIEVVPTLALQIASNIPNLRPIIGLTAFQDRDIFSEPLDLQLEALIFNPFRQYTSIQGHAIPVVLLIDGLDLFHDPEKQKVLTSSIEMVATTSCIPIRFLMTSRQSSQESGLPFEPGTHVHIHNGLKPPSLPQPTHQSPFNSDSSSNASSRPYHGFPLLLQTHSSISEAEAYNRSLIMLGHGVPVWRPKGSMAAPAEYLQHGPEIGDIMYIHNDGAFRFLGNIFHSPKEPTNRFLDGRYEPLTLDPLEVTRVENFFKPGTVITSTGVATIKKSDAPLTFNFKSHADEGAILVLPEGASREDIQLTKHLHRYVQRWAPYWYKYRGVCNGSIFIVTGCDKASDFACATFFSNPAHELSREIDMDYIHSDKGDYPWSKQGRSQAHHNTLPNPERVRRFSVFLRGMRIALGNAVWSSHNNSPIARDRSAYSNVFYKPPLFRYVAESILVRLRYRTPERQALKRVSTENNLFHPIFVLGPDLFQRCPKASVVVINDSDWSMLTQEGHGEWVHMKALIKKLYRHFDVVEDTGVVSLSRKTTDHKDMNDPQPRISIQYRFSWNNHVVKPVPVSKFVHDLGETPDSDS